MEPLKPLPTFKAYALIKQSGLSLSYVYSTGNNLTFGPGFYTTREEAEHLRTLEILKDTAGDNKYHVFELEIFNPAFQE